MKLTGLRSMRNRRGAALVEMAFAVPLLMLLVFGIIEFGSMLNTYQAVGQCAREGVRAAALGATRDAVEERVRNTAVSKYDLDSAKVTSIEVKYNIYESANPSDVWDDLYTTSSTPSGADRYTQVRVSVSYNYSFITGSLFSWLSGSSSMPLTQATVMRKEG